MQKTLVYDNSVSGHHLEYLHHFYERAYQVASRKRQFVFVVPTEFKECSKKMEWAKNENISFVFFDVPAKTNAYWNSKKLAYFIKENNVTDVLLVALMGFLPWLPFFMPKGVKVSGIIYMIYLYRWQKSGFKTKLLDVLKYLIFKYCSCINQVFLLNDKIAPKYLNKLFKTKKFDFLPDPVAVDVKTPVYDVRIELNVPANARFFSHFGGLAVRKGTLDILEAINSFPQNFKNDYFVFAGRVGADIREQFYSLVSQVKEKGMNIIVKDEFIGYEFLKSLAASSTAILIPYHNTEQSSGLIAYAAATGVPVIAPCGGLLGKLVKRYKLGIFLEKSSCRVESIVKTLNLLNEGKLKIARSRICGNDYLRDNSLEEFQRSVIGK